MASLKIPQDSKHYRMEQLRSAVNKMRMEARSIQATCGRNSEASKDLYRQLNGVAAMLSEVSAMLMPMNPLDQQIGQEVSHG